MRHLRGVFIALALSVTAVPAAAQLVTGRLVDRTTGEPLDGAFVVLVDSTGVDRGGILTNREGRYFLRVPGPGRYTIRAERIGYASATSEPLMLAADETRVYDMAVSTQAIELESIRVTAEQRCTVHPGSGARIAAVWNEARKALQLAVWTEQQRVVRYRVVNFERELDPETLRVRRETRTGASGYADGSPYRSLAPEDLAEHGYIRPSEATGWTYYAPDAGVLLSDAFLDGHCLELEQDAGRPGLIGLAFRPVERSDRPDIEGVLWLDRRSAELRYLEFSYTTLPFPVSAAHIGGRVDFARVAGGPWIVRSWWIRMPEVGMQQQVLGVIGLDKKTYRLLGIREAGGEVLNVDDRSSDAVLGAGAPGGSLAGVVYDSSGFVTVANIQVTLAGTEREARTATDGRFAIHGLPEGRYGLRVTPRAWPFPWPPPEADTASVRNGDTTFVRLLLPNTDAVLRTLCSEPPPDDLPGVVFGRVTDAAGRPIAGDSVVVSWSQYAVVDVTANVQARWQAAVVQGGSLPADARQSRLQGARILRLDLTRRGS
ncbi:MAG: carboxypeptidase-like regulatory domain-containing protein [Gemmatimonadota bacterium]